MGIGPSDRWLLNRPKSTIDIQKLIKIFNVLHSTTFFDQITFPTAKNQITLASGMADWEWTMGLMDPRSIGVPYLAGPYIQRGLRAR